jgi:hypothetical protein
MNLRLLVNGCKLCMRIPTLSNTVWNIGRSSSSGQKNHRSWYSSLKASWTDCSGNVPCRPCWPCRAGSWRCLRLLENARVSELSILANLHNDLDISTVIWLSSKNDDSSSESGQVSVFRGNFGTFWSASRNISFKNHYKWWNLNPSVKSWKKIESMQYKHHSSSTPKKFRTPL